MPSADRLDTAAVLAATKQNAQTVSYHGSYPNTHFSDCLYNAFKAQPNFITDFHCDGIYHYCCKTRPSGETEQEGSREEACPQRRFLYVSFDLYQCDVCYTAR